MEKGEGRYPRGGDTRVKVIKSDSDSDSDEQKKVVSFWEEVTRGDTAELPPNKGRQVFQEKIEEWHPQLPPRVSPTLVTPLTKALQSTAQQKQRRI